VTGRNRSEGWTHAKLSGHALEHRLAEDIVRDRSLSSRLHEDCFGTTSRDEPCVTESGIGASKVACVLGGLTTGKTDLCLRWPNGRVAKLSLKKSASGQVWLVSAERFFAGFKAQFGTEVPKQVQLGLRLFIGPIERAEMERLLRGSPPLGPTRKGDGHHQELHQCRFVARSLETYAPTPWNLALEWLRAEMPRIAQLCFAIGLCSDTDAQADRVWYHLRDEKGGHVTESRVIPVAAIVLAIQAMPFALRATVGKRNGGSTIITPFGFLQMHRPSGRNQMQFHHVLRELRATLRL